VRRLVVDNGWYKALLRENVELIVDPIDRFTPEGIRTRKGKQYEVDLVVLATGFKVSKFLWPTRYTGRDGATPESTWSKDGARAYLGMLVPGLPNFFVFYGPNAQPRGGNSLYSWAECWSRYAAKAIIHLIENNKRWFDVRQDAFEQFNEKLDAVFVDRTWIMDGHSYYVNAYGRDTANMPLDIEEYYKLLEEPNFDHFVFG
jgi:4-hydroxyacetophenone monooxygenase